MFEQLCPLHSSMTSWTSSPSGSGSIDVSTRALSVKPTKSESPVNPDQSNPSDKNSPDAKKTKNAKAQNKKNRDGQN